LGVSAASRFLWISYYDCLHAFTNGRGTRNKFRDDPQDISEPLSKISHANHASRLAFAIRAAPISQGGSMEQWVGELTVEPEFS
jgi:hypothetical protein